MRQYTINSNLGTFTVDADTTPSHDAARHEVGWITHQTHNLAAIIIYSVYPAGMMG